MAQLEPGSQRYSRGKVELLNSDIAGWSGVFGISIVDNELQTSGAEAFLPTSEHEEFSVHIVQSLEVGEWSTEIGVRYDKVDLDNNSVSRSFDVGNASVGLGYRLNEHSYLGSSISMSERAPSISEFILMATMLQQVAMNEETL